MEVLVGVADGCPVHEPMALSNEPLCHCGRLSHSDEVVQRLPGIDLDHYYLAIKQ